MRRLSLAIVCSGLLFVSFFSVSQASPTQAASISNGCYYVNAMGGTSANKVMNLGMMTFNAGEIITVSQVGSDYLVIYNKPAGIVYASSSGTHINWTVPANGSLELYIGDNVPKGAIVTISCSAAADGSIFYDGRVNTKDAGETVAGYCQADGSIRVYAIDRKTSHGHLAFVASAAEIAKVPHPTHNTVIKSGGGATLYRLTSGELQLNRAEEHTGKMYSFIFGGCHK